MKMATRAMYNNNNNKHISKVPEGRNFRDVKGAMK